MNNTAIYKVIENGKETNLHSSFAGGYSYPILLYTKAEKIAADMRSNGSLSKCGIADVLLLMTADDIFPEEHKGKKIFCPGSVWDIDSYELLELFCAEDYGRYILETNPGNISDKEMLDSLEDYINYYDYGCSQAERDGAVQTDYGFIFRHGDMEQTETQDTVMSM